MSVEVTPTLSSVLKGAIEAHMSDVHVAMPGRVVSYDASSQSVSVEPLVRRGYVNESGTRIAEKLPIINHVPVCFPGSGGFRVTFPVTAGDTVLLVFSSSSLDQWLAKGGDVDPVDDRRHAFSDAICIPGLRDFTNSLSDAPTDVMTAGSDGGAVIEFDTNEIRVGGSGADVTLTATNFLSALDTLVSAIATAVGGISGATTNGAAITTANTAFKAAASTYKSTIAKVV